MNRNEAKIGMQVFYVEREKLRIIPLIVDHVGNMCFCEEGYVLFYNQVFAERNEAVKHLEEVLRHEIKVAKIEVNEYLERIKVLEKKLKNLKGELNEKD